jgi:tetratricopeptide (TPR) repeat protein
MQYNVMVASRGLELFRDDPELLFLGGAMHETFATPAIQEPLRGTDLGTRTGVLSAKMELNTAEDLLRRAVKLRADFPEARLRLGHVLGELDRHKDALPELTLALAGLQNPNLQYYGHLFTGRSAAAKGDVAMARAAFEHAARLMPAAQSPLLSLSQLAYGTGNADEAAALLNRVLELPALDGDDPWWTYNVAAGRFYELSFQDLVATLRGEMAR